MPSEEHLPCPIAMPPTQRSRPKHSRCSVATAALSLLPLVAPGPTRSVMDGCVSMVSGGRVATALGGDTARGLPVLSPPLVPASGGDRMDAGGEGMVDMPERLGELKAAGREVGERGGHCRWKQACAAGEVESHASQPF